MDDNASPALSEKTVETTVAATNAVENKPHISEWRQVLEILRGELSAPSFTTAFGNSEFQGFSEQCLRIGAANSVVKSHIEKNHLGRLDDAVKRVFGDGVTVKITVSRALYREHRERDLQRAACDNAAKNADLCRRERANSDRDEAVSPRPLFADSGATFADFAVGDSNQFACAASKQLIEHPANVSPLLVYGNHGLGKTHLLHAACHAFSVANPKAKIICQSADRFVREFGHATVEKRSRAFLDRYYHCDFLAIDDFHALGEGAKCGSQKEIAQIFDHLRERGVPIMLTALKTPLDIDGIPASLRSRLQGGVLAKVDPLDEFTRRKIIAKIGADLALSAETLAYLTTSTTGDVREIAGILKNLRLRREMTKTEITPEIARLTMAGLVAQAPTVRQKFPLDALLAASGGVYGITSAAIIGRERRKTVSLARRAFVHLAKMFTGASLTEIGRFLGDRTHVAVLAMLKKPPFETDLEKRQFAAVLAKIGEPSRPEEFLPRRQTEIFNDDSADNSTPDVTDVSGDSGN